MVVRQTRALAVLVFRYWARAGLPSRLRKDQGRRASGGLFRAAGCATRDFRGVLLGFAAVTFGLLGGDATMRMIRVLVSPARVARAGIGMIVLQVPSMLVFVSSPMLGSLPRASHIVAPLMP